MSIKNELIEALQFRHNDAISGGSNWSNHHGLYRCDCDELIEFVKNWEPEKNDK